MREAEITINGQLLTQAQSATLRTACHAFAEMLGNPAIASTLGQPGMLHRVNLDTILRLIDETVA